MTKDEFNKLIVLFYSEFTGWCRKKLKQNDNNYEIVASNICDIMLESLHTDERILKEFTSILTPENIETTIKNNRKEGHYRFERIAPKFYQASIEWELRKIGGTRVLNISLTHERILYITSGNWDMSACDLTKLEQAIMAWAMNLM